MALPPFRKLLPKENPDNPPPNPNREGSTGPTLNPLLGLNDLLTLDVPKVVHNTAQNAFHPPHCDTKGCRLPRGCDVQYNPYKDPHSERRVDDPLTAGQPGKYKSPFERRNPSQSPKRRKLHHEDGSLDSESSGAKTLAAEPSSPFSEKSWLALEFYLMAKWNVSISDDRIMACLLKMMPDLDFEECLAMDILRLTYPEPNIYDDDDEDESTQGSKLHKLHMRVHRMPPEEVNPSMEELNIGLIHAGYSPHLVLQRPRYESDGLLIDDWLDDTRYNFALLDTLTQQPHYFCPHVIDEATQPESLEEEHKFHERMERRRIEERNNATELYMQRLSADGARTQAAKEAIRLVRELTWDPRTNCRIQVESVRVAYQLEGKLWPPWFSQSIDPADIEPVRFAKWVDSLTKTQYEYASKAIHEWWSAGLELNRLLKPYRQDQRLQPQQVNPLYMGGGTGMGAISPKRTHSDACFSGDDEEPSNDTPPLIEEQLEIMKANGETYDALLERALRESMKENQRQSGQTQSPTAASVGSSASTVESDQLMTEDQELEMAIQLSKGWDTGSPGEDGAGARTADKTSCDTPLPSIEVATVASIYRSPYLSAPAGGISRPWFHKFSDDTAIPPVKGLQATSMHSPSLLIPPTKLASPTLTREVVMGGFDGGDETCDPIKPAHGSKFHESFVRETSSDPAPPSVSVEEHRKSLNHDSDVGSHAHGNIPTVTVTEVFDEIGQESTLQNHSSSARKLGTYSIPNPLHRYYSRRRPADQGNDDIAPASGLGLAGAEPVDATKQSSPPQNSRDSYWSTVISGAAEKVSQPQTPTVPQKAVAKSAWNVLKQNRQTWLKEDEEWEIIRKSDKSLGELLLYGNFPYLRRNAAVISTIVRPDAIEGFAERVEKRLESLSLSAESAQSSDAGGDSDGVESAVPSLAGNSPSSPRVSVDSSSTVPVVQENVSSVAKGLGADVLNDGQMARSMAITAVYANTSSGIGGLNNQTRSSVDAAKESLEPFPDPMGQSDNAQMPAADIGVFGSTTTPNQAAGEVVVGPLGGSFPSGLEIVAQSDEANSMGSFEAGLGHVDVEGADVAAVGDVKKPHVDVAEIKDSDLAKEA